MYHYERIGVETSVVDLSEFIHSELTPFSRTILNMKTVNNDAVANQRHFTKGSTRVKKAWRFMTLGKRLGWGTGSV